MREAAWHWSRATDTVPSTPTGVTATPEDGQVVVSWSAPDDGGSPITAYVVTPYVNGVAQVADTSVVGHL